MSDVNDVNGNTSRTNNGNRYSNGTEKLTKEKYSDDNTSRMTVVTGKVMSV